MGKRTVQRRGDGWVVMELPDDWHAGKLLPAPQTTDHYFETEEAARKALLDEHRCPTCAGQLKYVKNAPDDVRESAGRIGGAFHVDIYSCKEHGLWRVSDVGGPMVPYVE
jgi:hypothetical protein